MKTTHLTEKFTVGALCRNDMKAFDTLYNQYARRLYAFAYGYLKNKEESEEIVQDVFMTIWKRRHDIDPEGNFHAYLFKIAYHRILESFRQSKRNELVLHKIVEDVQSTDKILDEQLNYKLILEKVERIIGKLPPQQSKALLLKRRDGLSLKEIAEQMSISSKTVENHITTAIRNLKKELKLSEFTTILLLNFIS